ncbi:MAG TPA: hypothetical protein VIN40_07670 [Candidatus Tyrphobacter sp.]
MLAVARTPMLLCVLADTGDAILWERMLDALDAVSPLVDDVRVGLAYLDMRGMPGDARRWIARTREVLMPYGVGVRIGAGADKFTAYTAVRVRDGTICAAGGERDFLAPLPIDLLEIEERPRERLRLLGVTTLGALARLPHGAFVRRFGRDAARWHACACGEDRSVFLPRAHAVAIEASTFGEGRVEEEAQLFFALRVVLARVCADLERCGKRAGALELLLELEDGTNRRIEIALASPSAHEKTLGDVVRAKMTGGTFPCAIVGLRLRAVRLEEGGETLPIFAADDVDPRSVAVTLARLEAVTGEPPRRARTHAAHALERRFSYESFSFHPERGRKAAVERPMPAMPETPVPQLRLLAVHEIEVRLRGGAPAFVGDRAVRSYAGPWRIEEAWFADTPIARDEYDVLLDDDTLVRIYRQGRHWYLRGAYD